MTNIQKKLLISFSILLLLLLLLIGYSDMGKPGFDASIWQAQKGSAKRENPRASMIYSLEKNYLNVGMSREKIRKLLGAPDKINDQVDIYDIGVSPYGIDMEMFQLFFDKDKLVKFQISRY